MPGAKVGHAYLQALADPFDKVVQLACLEVGSRGGPESMTALMKMLAHPSWRVRLEACKALITQGTADHRVVSALETTSREPEAAVYNAEAEDAPDFLLDLARHFGDHSPQLWGKLETIIARARAAPVTTLHSEPR